MTVLLSRPSRTCVIHHPFSERRQQPGNALKDGHDGPTPILP